MLDHTRRRRRHYLLHSFSLLKCLKSLHSKWSSVYVNYCLFPLFVLAFLCLGNDNRQVGSWDIFPQTPFLDLGFEGSDAMRNQQVVQGPFQHL
jgi:hypothetical protein